VRADIAVNDICAVKVTDAIGSLREQIERLTNWERNSALKGVG
jgi:hypothetical protein